MAFSTATESIMRQTARSVRESPSRFHTVTLTQTVVPTIGWADDKETPPASTAGSGL